MKKLLSLVLVLTLLISALVFPASAATKKKDYICNLKTFIKRYNAIMKELEYKQIYGVDASISEKKLTIKKGDVNDTIQFKLPNFDIGVIQLNLKGGTKNIVGIWFFVPTRGDDKAPEFLLELFSGLTHGAGSKEDGKDVTTIM